MAQAVDQKTRVPVELEVQFILQAPRTGVAPAQAIVLLHGYTESGRRIHRALAPFLPDDALILAPDGPFPLPVKSDKGLRLGHCWYLYNPETDEYVVDMRAAQQFARGLLNAQVPAGLPITIVGFSQGGYFAPFLAQVEPRIRRVVGIACQFLDEELEGELSFELHGIHGEQDQVVDPSVAARSHRKLLARGVKGTFTVIPGAAHEIGAAVGHRVAEILKSET